MSKGSIGINTSSASLQVMCSVRMTFSSAGWTTENIGTSVPAVSIPQKTPTTMRKMYLRTYGQRRAYASHAVYSRSKNSFLYSTDMALRVL